MPSQKNQKTENAPTHSEMKKALAIGLLKMGFGTPEVLSAVNKSLKGKKSTRQQIAAYKAHMTMGRL